MDQHIIQEFINIVGEKNVKMTTAQLLAYSYDATANYQALPDCVLSPRNTEEVSEIVKICNEHKIPIVPRGSGSNLAAGTVPNSGGVVLLFNHMNKIVDFDKENLTITVQPGVITADICSFVEKENLFYPPDPSSMKISTIGGNICENSGGLRGLKYGVTKDYVKGLTAVLPNGEILKTGGKLAKDVAGYDLTALLVGSEGTLAVITEIILKLVPLPKTKMTGIAYFNSLEASAKTVSSIIANKIIPVTLEFLDKKTIEAVEQFMKIGLSTEVEAMLIFEQDGDLAAVEHDVNEMTRIANENGAIFTKIANDEAEADKLKTARRVALSALSRLRPTTILEDATVPRSEIAKMVNKIDEIAKKYNLSIATFGHAGDGNLHPTCVTDVRDQDELNRVELAFSEIFEEALLLGGTITGEHGVGEMKAPYLEWKIGEAGLNIMKGIKKAFDPNNIMNPGKVFAKETKKRVVLQSVR
ncbi:FAD-linked oxidase C-terminal domain-containing protein [Lysinibacillus endophyticus]|uniref:FAD-binding protein n=1 Tax=Ureibacillus endophyticus TaxID=1978490 RepID=A0A494YZX8_9BACL|nr:FAD-linked oxidase C-terminal domain-containing protein [Lysinibacillus endophyticus]RKQ15780.1 FAD-binding protein [Lysinibacillus endophyticus]